MYIATNVSKSFGGVRALRDADLILQPGEVHALVGSNGAGKSTLVSVLVGALSPDVGSLERDGRPVFLSSVADAGQHGIAVVSQELTIFPDLDVLTNLFLLREPMWGPVVSRRLMRARAQAVLDWVGLEVDLDAPASALRLGEQQLLEICRALLTSPDFLFLDEPTSSLTEEETGRLHQVVRDLRARGVGVVYVSHFLDEVLSLCDVVTVVRDGRILSHRIATATTSVPELVELMTGQRPEITKALVAESPVAGKETVVFEKFSVPGRLRDVTLRCHAGEIIGLAGLEGSGPEAVFDSLFGRIARSEGTLTIAGRSRPRSTSAAVKAEVALVPADRKGTGGMLDLSIRDNVLTVAAGPLNSYGPLPRRVAMTAEVRRVMTAVGVSHTIADRPLQSLSGGNQQKVILAKWIAARPSILLLDDPTRGVDVAARAELHRIIRSMAAEGATILVRSSHLDELLDLAHRIVVFHRGSVTAEYRAADLDTPRLTHAVHSAASEGGSPQMEGARR